MKAPKEEIYKLSRKPAPLEQNITSIGKPVRSYGHFRISKMAVSRHLCSLILHRSPIQPACGLEEKWGFLTVLRKSGELEFGSKVSGSYTRNERSWELETNRRSIKSP